MRPFLKRTSSPDLLAIAVFGGQAVSDRVDDELDRRAAAAVVRRVLRLASGRWSQSRQKAGAVVAAWRGLPCGSWRAGDGGFRTPERVR
ncbi:MAG: hypothetical protein IMZ66_06890 [Planctomycetes bacterium]|nr:hypothetical protein [Planctomycetota bacterium]